MPLSIGKKILLSLLVVALIPLVVLGLITYRVTSRAMKVEVIAGLSALSESTFEHFVDYVDEKESTVTMLSHTQTVIYAMEWYGYIHKESGIEAEDDEEAQVSLDTQYRPLMQYYSRFGFNDLYLLTISGDIVFSLSDKECLGRNVVKDMYRDTELAGVFKRARESSKTEVSQFKIFQPTKKPAIFMASPIMNGSEVLGFIVFSLDTTGLYKHVKDYTGLGDTGEIVLAEREGKDIVFVAPLRHDPEAAFKRKVRVGSMAALPIQHALNKEDGAGISIDYRGKSIVAVWKYFAPMHLGLVIKQDTSEAFSLVGDLRRMLLFVGGLTLLLVLVISAFVAKSIARPIKALHEGAEKVGHGDLSYRVGTGSRDEIGQLSRAFDEMTENLSWITASRDELDKEIAERKEAEQGLKESEERLLEYSKGLEIMVEKRTEDLKELQEKLITKEKLAAIGQLSSSVGHELRNPLGVINNSVYYLNMKLKDHDGAVAKHLGILSREVRRSNKIISDLLDFSRERGLELSLGDISGLIRETLAAMDIAENIDVDLSCLAELPDFLFDADQMHQLTVNLVTNALHAMADGGTLCITTAEKKGVAEIAFQDSGVGIPEGDLKKIFDPLYTTKSRGTGLGLSIVKGIVDRHGGTVTVRSRAGDTVFTVRLPLKRKTS